MLFRGSELFNLPLGHIGYDLLLYKLPAFLKWNKWILTFNFENNAAQWWMIGEFQQCIIRKHNGHTLRWRYDCSHTPGHAALGHSIPLFQGSVFLDALYTWFCNRDSERSMINATILERRFERRLQTRFDLWYWNVILLLEKEINAPLVAQKAIKL